jgi:hypothetical protein
MASSGRKRRLVSSLDGEVLERLSMKLNPRMLLKDYQSLAGRLKYTYEFIRNFARERDPTLALLQHWWSSKRGKEKTVSVLIDFLSDMERDDCVDLLRPYEFYGKNSLLCSILNCVLFCILRANLLAFFTIVGLRRMLFESCTLYMSIPCPMGLQNRLYFIK